MNLNQIQIIGRLGKEAKVVDHNGRKFLAFSVAVDDSYKDSSGTKVERTVWYDCASESERYMKLIQWLQKGREVFIQGKPSVRQYTGQDNRVYANIRIQITALTLGNLPAGQQTATSTGTQQAQPAPAAPAAQPSYQSAAPPAAWPQPAGQNVPFAMVDDVDELPF